MVEITVHDIPLRYCAGCRHGPHRHLLRADTHVGLAFCKIDEVVDYIKANSDTTPVDECPFDLF